MRSGLPAQAFAQQLGQPIILPQNGARIPKNHPVAVRGLGKLSSDSWQNDTTPRGIVNSGSAPPWHP